MKRISHSRQIAYVISTFLVSSFLMFLSSPTFALTWEIGGDSLLTGITPMFVAEGRIGNNAMNGDFEVDLGPDTSAPAFTQQFVWPNGQSVPFILTYNPITSIATFQVDSLPALNYTQVLNPTSTGDIYLRVRAPSSLALQENMKLDNLLLDGMNLLPLETAMILNMAPVVMHISGDELLDGWTLSGDATMSWGATMPLHSNIAFQIKGANPSTGLEIPEPSTILLLGAGLAGVGLLRRKFKN